MEDWTNPKRRKHDIRDLDTLERLAIFPREPGLDGIYEGIYEKTGKPYSVRIATTIVGELRARGTRHR